MNIVMKNSEGVVIQGRQGDVYVERISEMPDISNMKKIEKEGKRIVLAHGEVTGHAHAFNPEASMRIEQWSENGGRELCFLKIGGNETVNLSHEEHGFIPLTPGAYKVTRQREYTPEEIRNVAD